jgi:hypothetical protein
MIEQILGERDADGDERNEPGDSGEVLGTPIKKPRRP